MTSKYDKNQKVSQMFLQLFYVFGDEMRDEMNGANFLTCSQGLNCRGTREVRSDVSILKAPLAAASVHCDHTSPTQTYDGTNRDRPQHRALRALLFANSACVLLRPTIYL